MQDYQPRMLSTYALTLFRHNAEINGEPVKVDFWDTAGQERFNPMHPAYYHQAHACILCFDVTRKATYKNLPAWLKELRDYRTKIPTICIANKVDVDTKVMSKEFAFPKKHGMPLCECPHPRRRPRACPHPKHHGRACTLPPPWSLALRRPTPPSPPSPPPSPAADAAAARRRSPSLAAAVAATSLSLTQPCATAPRRAQTFAPLPTALT
jgi:hypothetical protein